METATSNTNWTCPQCVTSLFVECWGQGGDVNGGSGGGGGAYSAATVTVVPGRLYQMVFEVTVNGVTGTGFYDTVADTYLCFAQDGYVPTPATWIAGTYSYLATVTYDGIEYVCLNPAGTSATPSE